MSRWHTLGVALVLLVLICGPASAAIKACTACNSTCNSMPGTPNMTANMTMNMTANMTSGPNNDAWYMWINATRILTGKVNLGGFNLSNMSDPVVSADAATRGWAISQINSSPAGGLTSAQVVNLVYPVGSIYISTVNTNPATVFGVGTWATFGNGRVLVGNNSADSDFDTAEKTGGAKTNSSIISHTHTISVTDPGHSHIQSLNSASSGSLSGYSTDASTSTLAISGYNTTRNTTGITASEVAPAGALSSINIMDPYIVVYMWKRTA